ncbi:hypothetical protein ACQKOC_16690 [Enterobacter mori]
MQLPVGLSEPGCIGTLVGLTFKIVNADTNNWIVHANAGIVL